MSYDKEKFFINKTEQSEIHLLDFLKGLKGYLVTEYLHPHIGLAKFSGETANALRYLIAKDNSGKKRVITRFIRFGTKQSNFVENYNRGGVLTYIQPDGSFNGGNVFDFATSHNVVVTEHPDSHVLLKGNIPLWSEIERVANELMEYMPQMNYLGIDFVVTDKDEVKILEINSLTSLDTIQLCGSVFQQPEHTFFEELLS